MHKMVKPLYVNNTDYDVMEVILPGNTLDEKLDNLKKGRTVLVAMALSLYQLDEANKQSVIKASCIKGKGRSIETVNIPKHVTLANMQMLLCEYAKKALKSCKHDLYLAVVEEYINVSSDTNMSKSTHREYLNYIDILVSFFGMPEQFNEVTSYKLGDDGICTVEFKKVGAFVTKKKLQADLMHAETELERVTRELVKEKAKTEKLKEKVEVLSRERDVAQTVAKARLLGEEVETSDRIKIRYTISIQIGIGGESPFDKYALLPELIYSNKVYANALKSLVNYSTPQVLKLLANLIDEEGNLNVEFLYHHPEREKALKEVVNFTRRVKVLDDKKSKLLSCNQ